MSKRAESPRKAALEEPYCNEIVLHPDGRVAFKHLSTNLLELAAELAPQDERLQRRLAAAARNKP